MHRHGLTFLRHLPVWRRVGGLGLLSAFLFNATPLPAAVTALVALADKTHHAAVQQTARGVQVVLRHDCFISPVHRHGLVAQALTLIAQKPTKAQPDHLIQFAFGDQSARTTPLAFLPLAPPAAPAFFAPCDPLPASFDLKSGPQVQSGPPPPPGGWLLSLRCTVLLI